MSELPDSFTVTDRRDLMKQGLQLDALTIDISGVKSLLKEDIVSLQKAINVLESRIRSLEDFNIKIRTSLWIIGTFFTMSNLILSLVFKFWIK